jgi:hypothetical protein
MGRKAAVGRAGQSAPIAEMFGGIPPPAFLPAKHNSPLSQNNPLLQKVLTKGRQTLSQLRRQLFVTNPDGNLNGNSIKRCGVLGAECSERIQGQRNLQPNPFALARNGQLNRQAVNDKVCSATFGLVRRGSYTLERRLMSDRRT